MGYVNQINKASVDYDLQDARIQDDLSQATDGQLLSITTISGSKKIIPVDAPETGVITFNGRSGAVVPASGDYDASMVGAIDSSLKGANNGVAELDNTGKVPTAQLPSYVDDVLEYDTLEKFPVTGETGKIYIAKDTNKTYRWSGTQYVEISASLALGETSSTAYAGNKGKANADAIGVINTTLSGYGNIVTHNVNEFATSAQGEKADSALQSHQTVILESGTNNGTLKVTTAAGETDNIAVTGLGSAAYTETNAYAAASHTQAASTITGLAGVATSGSYNDLSDKPTIPSAQVNSDWNANSGVAQILNKPTLANVATSGSYNDLSNKPTIPASTATAGSATRPVYISAADVATPCTYGFGIDANGPYIESF